MPFSLLPYRRVALRSPLSAEEVQQRLQELVAPRLSWWALLLSLLGNDRAGKDFIGDVEMGTFDIFHMRRQGRSLLMPRIVGRVHPELSGTRIEMTLLPVMWTLAPFVAWVLSGLYVAFFTGPGAHPRPEMESAWIRLIPFPLVLSAWGALLFAFGRDAKIALVVLTATLEVPLLADSPSFDRS